jgi:2-polyprenyl-6-hydroxyphenyl methylase/3-demethylubiquinone-9 3-methyltransferase
MKNNVDTQEIAQFDAAANSWWDLQGPYKSLHDINPVRLSFIESCTSLLGKTILDVGCGGGVLSEALARAGAKVMGVDASPQLLQVAKQHAQASSLNIDYQLLNVEAFASESPATFDAITCLEMLEHVPYPNLIIQACAKLVKPGGDLFFSTLNRNFKSYLLSIVGAEYVLNLLPRGTHDYAKFIKPSELDRWARERDLNLLKIQGMGYHLLSKKYYLSQDVSVNYIVHFKRQA